MTTTPNIQTTPLELLGETDAQPLATRAPAQLALPLPIVDAARAADAAAQRAVFAEFRARLAANTRRRHNADLQLLAQYLSAAGVAGYGADRGANLCETPELWAGLSWGLVAGFVQWQLQQGYAIGSINVRLSTVKTYAKLAAQAGALEAAAYALIALVQGYRQAQGRRVDAQREQTRTGAKKAAPTRITLAQASALKQQSDPLDQLLMCVLLDHGLRVGEVAALEAQAFDLDHGTLTFYREKVDLVQTHRLSDDTLAAASAALGGLQADARLFGVDRTIRRRVGQLGAAVGLQKLSPHDCRHAWATWATRAGTPTKALQDAGGWSSPAMPLRYAESQAIANEGVKIK